jgi:anti-repressor protein
MNELQIFKNNKFGEVRVTTTETGEPICCLADVCKIVDLQPAAIIRRLDEGVVSTQPLQKSFLPPASMEPT